MKALTQYFYLSPMHVDSNRVLEVLDSHTHNGAALGLGYLKPGATNQLWCFSPRDDGFYEVINKLCLKVLDDSSQGNRHPGGVVYQWTSHQGDNQRWRIKRAQNLDGVNIISKISGLVLDVCEWSQSRHAKMFLYYRGNDQTNQVWRLIRA